jgi:hypothetical protein
MMMQIEIERPKLSAATADSQLLLNRQAAVRLVSQRFAAHREVLHINRLPVKSCYLS